MKIRKEIKQLSFKPTNLPKDDTLKFEEKEVTKKRPSAKSIWFDWLLNYIPKSIKISG